MTSNSNNPIPKKIESPCVSVCLLDEEADVCKGCYRTIDEIAEWGMMSEQQRKQIMTELPARQLAHDIDQ